MKSEVIALCMMAVLLATVNAVDAVSLIDNSEIQIFWTLGIPQYPSSNTIDDNLNTFWHGTNGIQPGMTNYLAYRFNQPHSIDRIDLFNDFTNYYTMGELDIQISQNSTNGLDGTWATIDHINGDFTAPDGEFARIVNIESTLWVRFWMTYQGRGAHGVTPAFYLSEVDFYGLKQAEIFTYVPLTGENAVKVIRISDNTVVATVGVGETPTGVAVTPNGAFVYVANLNNDTVSVIRASDWSPVASIPVKSPAKVAITPDGAFAYVTNYFGQSTVSVIRTSNNTMVATVPVEGIRTWGIAITPDGAFAYVTDLSNNTSVIYTADNSVVATVPGGARGVAITPDGAFAYVTNETSNTVSVIRTVDNIVVDTIPVGIRPWGIAITPDGAFAYVTNDGSNNVSVILLSNHTVIATVSVGVIPRGVAITPDGAFAYVANYDSGTVSVIRTTDNTVVATIPVGTGPYEVAIGQILNHTPVAKCQNASKPAGTTCTADVSIDNGSFDPDGDPITLSQSPEGPYLLGSTLVTLTATDDQGASASCSATVTVVDGQPPAITCPDLSIIECTGPSGAPAFFTPLVSDNCGPIGAGCTPPSGSTFPLGSTPISCSAMGASGNSSSCSSSVTIVDTTAPVISSVSTSPNVLWPPNHKMVPVTVGVSAADVCDPGVGSRCQIISVTSNEPVDGLGDSDTAPDWAIWAITGKLTVNLRAERSGTGNGREYTVVVKCTDASGNSSTKAVTVAVPHDRRR